MKIVAFPINGGDLAAKVAEHFGRASHFLVYNLEQRSFEVCPNPEAIGERELPPEFLHNLGVGAVVCFGLGLPAFKLFGRLGVEMFRALVGGTVGESLEALESGALDRLTEEDIIAIE